MIKTILATTLPILTSCFGNFGFSTKCSDLKYTKFKNQTINYYINFKSKKKRQRINNYIQELNTIFPQINLQRVTLKTFERDGGISIGTFRSTSISLGLAILREQKQEEQTEFVYIHKCSALIKKQLGKQTKRVVQHEVLHCLGIGHIKESGYLMSSKVDDNIYSINPETIKAINYLYGN